MSRSWNVLRRLLAPMAAIGLLAAAAGLHAQSASAPIVKIVFPADGATLAAADFTRVEGTVEDRSGTGVSWVGYAILREGSHLEWDGEGQWIEGPTGSWIVAKVEGNAWTAPGNKWQKLPAADQMPPGNYVVYAFATDRDGDRSDPVKISFKVQPGVLLQ